MVAYHIYEHASVRVAVKLCSIIVIPTNITNISTQTQSRQSRQVLIQKWSKLLVRKMIKKTMEKNDKIR